MALNILIVDDSSVMRRIIRRCVEMTGLSLGEIHEGNNGLEGLDIINRSWVDIVITDINMPVMDGVEMIGHLREERTTRNLPIVVTSTEGSENRVAKLENDGVIFVHKPFHPETLREVILSVAKGAPSSDLKDVLARTTERVFADLAFIFVNDPTEVVPTPPTWAVRVSVAFSGAMSGQLVLQLTQPLMTAAATNMLALEDAVPVGDERERDAVRELASVICGNVVPVLGNPQLIFHLSSPELMMCRDGHGAPVIESDEAAAHALLALESGEIELWLFVDHPHRDDA